MADMLTVSHAFEFAKQGVSSSLARFKDSLELGGPRTESIGRRLS